MIAPVTIARPRHFSKGGEFAAGLAVTAAPWALGVLLAPVAYFNAQYPLMPGAPALARVQSPRSIVPLLVLRAQIKQELNRLLGSGIVEEKSYQPY